MVPVMTVISGLLRHSTLRFHALIGATHNGYEFEQHYLRAPAALLLSSANTTVLYCSSFSFRRSFTNTVLVSSTAIMLIGA